MSKDPNESSQASELERLRKLIELLRDNDLSEIDLRDATRRIRIRRGGSMLVSSMPASTAPQAATSVGSKPVEEDKNTLSIKSPMVGTFYSRPKPDQPSFVKVGDFVSPETIVCIVEAMKMFNEIPAGLAGKVIEVCVKDGEPVDVNKPLFKLAN